MDKHILRAALVEALGDDARVVDALLALDPEAATRHLQLAAATRRHALEAKARCFIELAVVASPGHRFEPAIRACIARALRLGASRDELVDVLRLTSIPAVCSLTAAIDLYVAEQGEAAAMRECAADTLAAHEACALLPLQSAALSAKLRELILLALEVSPAHFHAAGAAAHLREALRLGATREELVETFGMASLIGFNGMVVALPILREELARHEKDRDRQR